MDEAVLILTMIEWTQDRCATGFRMQDLSGHPASQWKVVVLFFKD